MYSKEPDYSTSRENFTEDIVAEEYNKHGKGGHEFMRHRSQQKSKVTHDGAFLNMRFTPTLSVSDLHYSISGDAGKNSPSNA